MVCFIGVAAVAVDMPDGSVRLQFVFRPHRRPIFFNQALPIPSAFAHVNIYASNANRCSNSSSSGDEVDVWVHTKNP